MFMDFRGEWPPQGEPPPRRSKPVLTRRGERVFTIVFGVNALLLLVAPIGGATLLQPLVRWLLP